MYELKRFPFSWTLGWSMSRYNEFSICKRRYYYVYYGKHDPEVPGETIRFLKDLSSIPLAIGVIVHHVIRVLLDRLKSTHAAIDEDRFFEYAERATREHLERMTFDEVVYSEMEEVGFDDVYPKVRSCLDNLLRSDRFRWLTEEAVATSDSWIIEPPGYGETRIDGLKAYVKVDFLFPMEDLIYIMDWKTGKRDLERHRSQLVGYAAWAAYHFGVDPAKVHPIVAYLDPEYEEIPQELNEFDIEDFSRRVKDETDAMYAYCTDIESNIPREKVDFPKVDNLKISAHCSFRGICFPEQYPLAPDLGRGSPG
jgi:CRISPR/Cas system-associated exonuclease Cas4 (RecB family)